MCGCDNVKCEHIIPCVTLSWEDPSGFRQRSDVIQFTILKDCSGFKVYVGDELEGLREDGPTSWRPLQPRLRGWQKSLREMGELWRYLGGRNDRPE